MALLTDEGATALISLGTRVRFQRQRFSMQHFRLAGRCVEVTGSKPFGGGGTPLRVNSG